MSRMVSRTEIRNLALRRADVEAETDETNGRFPTSEVNEEINRSLALYHTMLVGLRGADYFEKQYWVMPAFTQSNGAAPAITIRGVPAYQMTLVLTVTVGGAPGTAVFAYTVNGTTLGSVTSSATGAEIELDGTGLRIVNPTTGTYVSPNTYTSTATQFQTSPGVATYLLPDDFFQLTLVEAKISGVHVPLERFNRNQRPWLRDVNAWYGYDAIPMYRIRGDGRYRNTQFIEFSPTPSAAYDIDLWYIPQAAKYTGDTTGIYELPFDSGGEEWVALDVAIKLLTKDAMETGQLVDRMRKIESDLKEVFASRDAGMPERVVDRAESFGLGNWPWR